MLWYLILHSRALTRHGVRISISCCLLCSEIREKILLHDVVRPNVCDTLKRCIYKVKSFDHELIQKCPLLRRTGFLDVERRVNVLCETARCIYEKPCGTQPGFGWQLHNFLIVKSSGEVGPSVFARFRKREVSPQSKAEDQ